MAKVHAERRAALTKSYLKSKNLILYDMTEEQIKEMDDYVNKNIIESEEEFEKGWMSLKSSTKIIIGMLRNLILRLHMLENPQIPCFQMFPLETFLYGEPTLYLLKSLLRYYWV